MNTFILLATICFDAQCLHFVSDYDLSYNDCMVSLQSANSAKEDHQILYECKAEKEFTEKALQDYAMPV